MDEFSDTPSDPVPPPPRFRWGYILLCIVAAVMMIVGFAHMSGGERGVWGASHRTRAH